MLTAGIEFTIFKRSKFKIGAARESHSKATYGKSVASGALGTQGGAV
jgi:hypothetical protein